jgi:hypothetical protein
MRWKVATFLALEIGLSVAFSMGMATTSNTTQTEDTKMTRQDYLSRFDTLAEAVEYENQLLSIGEYLPACAQAVRDGEDATPEYWDFACGQFDQQD